MARRKNYRKNKKNQNITYLAVFAVLIVSLFAGNFGKQGNKTNSTANKSEVTKTIANKPAIKNSQNSQSQDNNNQNQDLANLKYTNRQIVAVNNNHPTFSQSDLSLNRGSWQEYGNLDSENRATVANAMLGKDLMPTQKRERLYIRPTGYHNKKVRIGNHYDWLYNRCHLIGYQLTGQNNNPKNLVTGTRSLNDPAMTFYENQIAKYIKTTNHHVRYQVKPIFLNNELVARGIQMQGQSIEDNEVSFNIYIFNVQSGVNIDYTNGYSTI